MSPIIKWSPFMDQFDEMDKMFSDFMPTLRSRMSQAIFTPAVDMYDDKDNVIVETQLAGVDPDKVDISIENDVLTIKGESEKKTEVEDKNYYRKEIFTGSFYRSVQLPTRVDGDKATAAAEGGVLKIVIPKAQEAKPKLIKVRSDKKQ
jgi:HSP20 family protein